MLGRSTDEAWMLSDELWSGPLADPGSWRGAVLWAIALYIPLSGPLTRFETSLLDSHLPEQGRQIALVLSSLLLALGVGMVTQLLMSWVIGPGWASSLAVIAIGWSLLLIAASQDEKSS